MHTQIGTYLMLSELLRKTFFIFIILATSSSYSLAEKRIALVIGNSNYENINSLNNASDDAKLIAQSLNAMNFEVLSLFNLTEDAMADAIDTFADNSRNADIAAVYYAGHGMQSDGKNYLMPVDTILKSPSSIERYGISLDSILKVLETVPVGLVFLDACRDNPFAEAILAKAKSQNRSASLSRGLAFVQPAGDTLIAYATLPGATASDGTDGHSPFARSLSQHMKTPDTEISVMMKRVTRDVIKATKGKQRPQLISQMQTEFYFSGSNSITSNPKPIEHGPLLAVYPPFVTAGEEVSVVADVPKSCKPFFLIISPADNLTPLPLQYFKQVDILTGQTRYEISPGSRYGLKVTEDDDKGINKLGFFCEPAHNFEHLKMELINQIADKIETGQHVGTVLYAGGETNYLISDFTIR